MSDWYGINYPFSGGIQNVLSRQVGIRIIKNDIIQLFLTNPGERVYRPDYGIGIKTYLYEQLDENSITFLDSRIRDQIDLNESRVSLDQLSLLPDNDNNMLEVFANFSLIQSPDEEFDINLSLPIFGGA